MFETLSLGERISLIRKIKSLKQKDIAVALGFSDKTISSWENNTSEPGLNEIKQLAKYLNVSINFIMEGIANNSEDKQVLDNIKRNQAIDQNRIVAYALVREIENLDNSTLERMFMISESQVLCNLQAIIEHGNLELFKAINQQYDFYVEKHTEKWSKSEFLGSDFSNNIIIKKHPINLEFSDISCTNNVEFYEYALEMLEQKVNHEIAEDKRMRESGYGHFARGVQTDKSAILCNALDNVHFDFENDAAYKIIRFLIDNGAYIRKYIPYSACSGYQVFRDDFMTNFVYATVINHLRNQSK